MGYVAGAHGIRGEIILVAKINDDSIIDDCLESEFIFHKDGIIKNLTVDEIREHKGNLLLKSEDIPDRNLAETFKGFSWLIAKEKMISQVNENIFLHEIEGFIVKDHKLGEIGPITGFANTGAQDLIEVKYKSKKAVIPLVKAFIVRIDFELKEVHMNLPEGLFDEV